MSPRPRASRGVAQVVAYNVRRLRLERGLTQEQVTELLEPYLGTRLTQANYSTLERTWDTGHASRAFPANQIAAFAAVFGVPIGALFLPPGLQDRDGMALTFGGQPLPWPVLIRVATGVDL